MHVGKQLGLLGLLLGGGFVLGGCAILPSAGPTGIMMTEYASDRVTAAQADHLPYAIVEVSPETLKRIEFRRPASFAGRFTDRRPAPTLTLGSGDIVTVAIFEASAGGLFIPAEAGSRSGNFVQLPAQEVDRQGNISIPYAGEVPAKGRTIREVQAAIEKRLFNRAIEPQAVVTITERRSAQVTVLGDTGSQRLTLNPLGERVLDVIARAGGTRYPGFEMYVTLQRGRQRATVTFNQLLASPADNVYVLPGDTLYVFRQAPTFIALGATTQQGQIFFEKESLSLTEAVAKIGGLIDLRADPDAVFVYRIEDRTTAIELGVDVSRFGDGETVPLIYRAPLRDPSGMFLTSSFKMRDRDIIYVANSASVDWLKLLQFINANISFAQNVATLPSIGSQNTTILRTNSLGTGLGSGLN